MITVTPAPVSPAAPVSGVADPDWMPRAARLAEEVTAAAAMNDPAWRPVIAAVPRHVFVPTLRALDAYNRPDIQVGGDDPAQRASWPDAAYANRSGGEGAAGRPGVGAGQDPPIPPTDPAAAHHGLTQVDPRALDEFDFQLWLALHHPSLRLTHHYRDGAPVAAIVYTAHEREPYRLPTRPTPALAGPATPRPALGHRRIRLA